MRPEAWFGNSAKLDIKGQTIARNNLQYFSGVGMKPSWNRKFKGVGR